MTHKVRYWVCAGLVLFTLSVNTQDVCTTPSNEFGICVPILHCDPLVPLVNNNNISAEDAKYLDSLQCGSLRLESFVCCVMQESVQHSTTIKPELSNDIETGGSCKTLNDTNGVCVPLYKCRVYVDILKNEVLSVKNFNFIVESKCGYEGDILKVCCPTLTVTTPQITTTPFSDSVELLDWCTTPNGAEGLCTVLNTCQHSMEILMQNPIPQEGIMYLRKSQCGMEGKIPKVCCPLKYNSTTQRPFITSEVPSRDEHMSCFTPNNERGLCIDLQKCPPCMDILKNEPISQEDRQFLRKSQCGYNENMPKVCCPIESLRIMLRFSNINQTSGYSKRRSMLLPRNDVCGKQNMSMRSINQQTSNVDQFPWIVLLKYDDGRFRCGGVLINRRYVLSAAHCITGSNIQQYNGTVRSIELGVYDLKNDKRCKLFRRGRLVCIDRRQHIPVEGIIVHPEWSNDSLHNDIALIRLSQEVNYTEFIQPICLTNQNNIIAEGVNVITAGWRLKEQHTNNGSRYKLKSQLLITNKNRCLSALSGQFCAGSNDDKKTTCSGDSGGPVMLQNNSDKSWYCVGLITASESCGFHEQPSVFTDISYYFDWIVSNLKE